MVSNVDFSAKPVIPGELPRPLHDRWRFFWGFRSLKKFITSTNQYHDFPYYQCIPQNLCCCYFLIAGCRHSALGFASPRSLAPCEGPKHFATFKEWHCSDFWGEANHLSGKILWLRCIARIACVNLLVSSRIGYEPRSTNVHFRFYRMSIFSYIDYELMNLHEPAIFYKKRLNLFINLALVVPFSYYILQSINLQRSFTKTRFATTNLPLSYII